MGFYNEQQKGRPVTIKDEGVILTQDVSSIDFTGAGVTGTNITDSVTETIPGSSGGGTWGSITGTLSAQTDLQTALDAKQDDITGADTQVLFFDGANSPAGDAGFTFNKTSNVATLTGGLITPKIYPASDSTNAVGIYKANGTTQILFTDTTNGRIGIGSAPTNYNLEVYSPPSTDIAMKIWTGGSGFGYTLGRNNSNGFLEIFGNQGIFSGISVDQIRSAGSITIAGNAVISNWAASLGIGSGSGTPNGKIEIRTSDNTVPNLAMGGGSGSNYNFRRDTGTGYLMISGEQNQFTGYRFSTGQYTDVFTMIDGLGAVFNETGEFALDFRVESDTKTHMLFVDASANAFGVNQGTPTAYLHIGAGTATAGTAPLKFNSGTNMTTAEAGAVEFTTDDLFFTITTGAARKAFILDDGTRLTSGRVPFATTNGRLTDDADMTFATDKLTVTKVRSTYYSSDDTVGLTASRVFNDGAVVNTVTIKDGIITAWTQV